MLSKVELENVLLCAEAAGYLVDAVSYDLSGAEYRSNFVKDPVRNEHFWYNPYTNDAAAMQLLQKYPLECYSMFRDYAEGVMMNDFNTIDPLLLNKGIVESVAAMMRRKRK